MGESTGREVVLRAREAQPRRVQRPGLRIDPDVRAEAGEKWIPGAIAALGLLVLVWGLVLPVSEVLRGDELTSLFRYSSGGPVAVWGSYIPNDHMLYELLTWGLRKITADHSEAVVRFWAIIPAIAAAGSLTVWLWRRLDPWVSAVFALLIATAPVFTDTGMEGRGYGLGFLAAALLLIGADTVVRTASRRGVVLFAIGGLIGIWTLPVFVLAFVCVGGLVLLKGVRRRDMLIAGGIVAGLSLLFYLPVIGDVINSSSQHVGEQLGPLGFITGPLKDQLQPSVQTLLHPVSAANVNVFFAHILSDSLAPAVPSADIIAAVVLVLSAIVMWIRNERFLLALLVVPAVFSYLVLEIIRSYVISRFASFTLPGLLILCAAGIVGGVRMLTARSRTVSTVAVVVGIVFAIFMLGKAYMLATANARPSNTALVSNNPTAFRAYVSSPYITAANTDELKAMACDDTKRFILLQFGTLAQPVSSCLSNRVAVHIATFALVAARGTVPGIVIDVPVHAARH